MSTPPESYRAFCLAVETGTITDAAAALALPRPTVSRQLARLEEDLGVALLHRTTRRVTPTAAGQRLYERVGPLLDQWASLEDDVRRDADLVRGSVRVSVTPVAAALLLPAVQRLRRNHPELTVELVSRIYLPDLRSEGFDAAVWAGEPRDPELISRTLTVGHVGLVASPAYLERFGVPASVEALEQHRLLRGHSGSARPRVWWPLRSGGRVRVGGTFVCNSGPLLRAAALAGEGICLLADLQAGEALEDGRLVRVLETEVGTDAALRLLTTRRTLIPARLRAFIDETVASFQPS